MAGDGTCATGREGRIRLRRWSDGEHRSRANTEDADVLAAAAGAARVQPVPEGGGLRPRDHARLGGAHGDDPSVDRDHRRGASGGKGRSGARLIDNAQLAGRWRGPSGMLAPPSGAPALACRLPVAWWFGYRLTRAVQRLFERRRVERLSVRRTPGRGAVGRRPGRCACGGLPRSPGRRPQSARRSCERAGDGGFSYRVDAGARSGSPAGTCFRSPSSARCCAAVYWVGTTVSYKVSTSTRSA